MRIGVDLGGTKIEGILMDERSRLVVRERVATPQGDYRETLEAIAGMVRRLEAAVGRQGLPVGVGHPGAISPSTGLLKNSGGSVVGGRADRRGDRQRSSNGDLGNIRPGRSPKRVRYGSRVTLTRAARG
jgi:predicted NBD/HSP70 family sugar kinase